MADIVRAENRMQKILLEWYCDDPIMLGVYCLVEKTADKRIKTMGIDSRIHPPVIRYNPNFVNSLNDEQLECVMASEGFKLLLRHPTTRLQKPTRLQICHLQLRLTK